jgi:hypothetical protein
MTVIGAKGIKKPRASPGPQRLRRPRAAPTAVVFSRGMRLGPRAFPRELPPWQRPPSTWAGSLPEWSVMWALTVKFRLQENIDFEYQASFAGGRQRLGGVIPDFLVYAGPVAINVDGLYFHSLEGAQTIANDLLATVILASRNIPLIHLLDVNLLENPIELVRQALAGIQPPGQIIG